MKTQAIFLLSILLVAGLLVSEASSIDVYLNLLKSGRSSVDFYPGDEISGSLRGENYGASNYYDIYVGFTLLDGSRIYWDGDSLTSDETPRWSDEYISSWTYVWSDEAFLFVIPEDIQTGEYSYFVEFKLAGESESAGSRSMPFQIHPPLQAWISTDETDYVVGNQIDVSLRMNNFGDDTWSDIYIALLDKEGQIHTLGPSGTTVNMEPWLSGILLPRGLVLDETRLWVFEVPCSDPPIEGPGEYSFIVGLANPGSLQWQCEPAFAPFKVWPVPESDYYVDAERGADSSDGSENSPWKTITKALNSLMAQEENPVTIHVASGTYSASAIGEVFPLEMKSWISLVGESRETTILDAEGLASHVIMCNRLNNIVIQGFTITGGSATQMNGDYAPLQGGGIYCDSSNTIISENMITGNIASYNGGAIDCHGSSIVIEKNIIFNNTTNYDFAASVVCGADSLRILDNTITNNVGTGLYLSGCESSLIRGNTISENLISGIFIGYTDDSVIIEENMIEGNVKHGIDCENSSTRIEHSSINSNGCAGIRYRNGSPTIECNVISGNQGDGDSGGGILCDWFGTSGRVLIIGNLIEGNSSYSGGGISCYSARDNSPIITHNSIRNNSAALGGGIYCDWGSSPLIFNNLICGNQATDAGGGLFCEDLCSPTLLNNTIAGNTAQNGPAGIFSYAMHSLVVKDNILWGNTSVAGPGDQLLPDYGEITFNCIQDWSNGGNSNISADPMLVDGPLGAYYLDPSSPCIDAGSQSAEDASLSEMTTQADGTPDTGTVDMGFHYPVPEE